MSNENRDTAARDHGQVVKAHHRTVAWVWIFPLLAAAVAGWLMWEDYKSMGPEIEITFDEAPGIQAGKTQLIYRGVISGKVESVELDDALQKVVVRIQLKEFAKGLATEETDFWVERPVITLTELAGLESIIQGNSIRARNPGGEPKRAFVGLLKPPLLPMMPGTFTVRLRGAQVPFLGPGTPVYHKGVKVGYVREKSLVENSEAELHLMIEPDHRATLRTTSRFWPVPATSLTVGQHGLKVDIQGIDALVQGGIAFDHFDKEGMDVANDALFALSASEFGARASGRLLTVTFDNGRGLVPGATTVCYLGMPIGLVEATEADREFGLVRASIRLVPSYEALADSAAAFTLVHPHISLMEVSGLDTLLTGVYIALDPGTGGSPSETFVGRSASDGAWLEKEKEGLPFTLQAADLPSLGKGTPVLYRGVSVGKILEKSLDEQRRPILRGVIQTEFRDALDANARFWRVPATSLKAGPGVLQLDVDGLQSLIQGGVAFDVFEAAGKTASANAVFQLYPDMENARAVSQPITIQFVNGRGIAPGRTELRYLGLPVGIVEKVETSKGKVQVTARLDKGHDFLRREGSLFNIVRPNISLQGISGLETLISGIYIECSPGLSTRLANSFTGHSTIDSEEVLHGGLTIEVVAEASTVSVGASVFYRGISVGRVTDKSLSSDGRKVVLTIIIEDRFSHLVRAGSKFWDSSGLTATLGFMKLRIQTESIMAANDRISFATPDNAEMGPPARDGDSFVLHPTSRIEWRRWNPTIPVEN
ncbi:MAG: MlaD family protein, partial [Terrimicrobiaceae bacterium]